MEKTVSRRGAFVGIVAVVLIALVLLIVPTVMADFTQVGIANPVAPQNCVMLDEQANFVELNPGLGEVEIFINETPGSDYPSDVVAVLKCRTEFPNSTGKAITYSGSSQTQCVVFFDPDDLSASSFTSTWSETISASGNAVLTCQFKRATPN